MNKLLTVAGAIALSVAFATAVPQNTSAATNDNGKNCTVETVGSKNGANNPNSKFVIKDGVAKVQFEVKGGPNCQKVVKLKLYNTLKEGGLPREAQVKILTKGGTYGVGKHHLSVKLNGACFYQLDLVNESNKQANGKYQMLGFVLGGKKSCVTTPTTPPTPETPVDQPPTTPEEETPDVPVTPETPETPVTPVVETPTEPVASETTEELAHTGPASTAALFAAVSAIAAIGYNLYSRRRNNA